MFGKCAAGETENAGGHQQVGSALALCSVLCAEQNIVPYFACFSNTIRTPSSFLRFVSVPS